MATIYNAKTPTGYYSGPSDSAPAGSTGGNVVPDISLSSTPVSATGVRGATTNQLFSGNSLVSSAITPSSMQQQQVAQVPQNISSQGGSTSITGFGGGTGAGITGGTLTGNNAGLAGGLAALGYTQDANGMFVYKAPTTDTTTTDTTGGMGDIFKQYLGMQAPPPSLADTYAKAEADAGIQAKRAAVQSYTNQLNTIVAQAQADVLSTQGQGRGIPEAIIGGQQAQINKEAAIKALPLQALLSAAQGDLQLAETHLDTLFKVYAQDVQNQYDYKNKLIDSVFQFATQQEQNRLDELKAEKANQFTLQRDAINYAQTLSSQAIQNGQGALAGQIMALDPNSKTYSTDVARLAGQIQGKTTNQIIGSAESGYTNVVTDASGKVISSTPVKGGSGSITPTSGSDLSDAYSAIASGADPIAAKRAYLADHPTSNASWDSYFEDKDGEVDYPKPEPAAGEKTGLFGWGFLGL